MSHGLALVIIRKQRILKVRGYSATQSYIGFSSVRAMLNIIHLDFFMLVCLFIKYRSRENPEKKIILDYKKWTSTTGRITGDAYCILFHFACLCLPIFYAD
jgi:hypothetical protein